MFGQAAFNRCHGGSAASCRWSALAPRPGASAARPGFRERPFAMVQEKGLARMGWLDHAATGERAKSTQPQSRQRRVQRNGDLRSEEHTSELQSLMRISYAVFCLKKKK